MLLGAGIGLAIVLGYVVYVVRPWEGRR